MYQRAGIAIAVATSLAACANKPPAQADAGPANKTAVFETRIVNSGVLGASPFEIHEKQYVRSAMRRDEHAMKESGIFSGWSAGEGDANIARLDKKVRWTVNNDRKEYTECPVHGCPPPQAKEEKKAEPRKEQPKQQAEKGCVMRISGNNLDVKPTGRKRSINGFNTDQYAVAWVVKMQDSAKRTTTSTLSFDVWTSPVTPQMRDAWSMEDAFSKAYLASAPNGRGAFPSAGSSGERARVMPPEVPQMMLSYLSNLRPADRAAFADVGKQVTKIQGHPISTKIEWRLAGDACAPKENQASSGSPLSALSGLFGKKDKPGEAPILSVAIEVKALKVEPVRDSTFLVPAKYKRVN